MSYKDLGLIKKTFFTKNTDVSTFVLQSLRSESNREIFSATLVSLRDLLLITYRTSSNEINSSQTLLAQVLLKIRQWGTRKGVSCCWSTEAFHLSGKMRRADRYCSKQLTPCRSPYRYGKENVECGARRV